jgi:integrase
VQCILPVVAAISQFLASTGAICGRPAGSSRRTTRGAGAREGCVGRLLRQAEISKAVRVRGSRHTFSVEVVRAGGLPFHLQKLLGHASVTTTQSTSSTSGSKICATRALSGSSAAEAAHCRPRGGSIAPADPIRG